MSAAVTGLAAPRLLCRVGQSVIEVRCGYSSRSSVLRSHPGSNGADFVWGLCLLDWREVQISATCSQDNRRSRDRAPQLLASHQIHQGLPLPAPAWRYEVHLALVFVLSSGLNSLTCFCLLCSSQAPVSDCEWRMQPPVSPVPRRGTQMCLSHEFLFGGRQQNLPLQLHVQSGERYSSLLLLLSWSGFSPEDKLLERRKLPSCTSGPRKRLLWSADCSRWL